MPHSVSPNASQGDDKAMQDAPEGGNHDPTSGDEMDVSADNDKTTKDTEVRLEELFQTDDEDDEFSSSYKPQNANSKVEPSSPPQAELPADSSAKYTDSNVMLAFYQRLFPFKPLYQWLNHSVKPSTDFAHREIAFTLQNDAYLRYQSYPTAEL